MWLCTKSLKSRTEITLALRYLSRQDCRGEWVSKRRNKPESLYCFLHGLKNSPEYRVSTKNPKTLREAANIAVNLEGRSKVLNKTEQCDQIIIT